MGYLDSNGLTYLWGKLKTKFSGATNWLNGSATGSVRTEGCTASGYASNAGGNKTIAQRKSQTVIGEYNIADTSGATGDDRGEYAFIVGNGTDENSRSNAMTADWDGNVDIASGAEYHMNGVPLSVLFREYFYPVGSYYETSDTAFNPNTAWGGTWVLETEGQVHISSGSNYPVNGAPTDTNDGGNKDAIVPYHRHSIAAHNTESSGTCTTGNMSANSTHSHDVGYVNYKRASTTSNVTAVSFAESTANKATSTENLQHTHTVPNHTHSIAANNTGYAGTNGNTTGANMQPYIIVNRWHRTA